MASPLRRLILASVLCLANLGIGAAIALREELPAEFEGKRSGKSARDDFLTGSGTALSPPLVMFIVQALWIGLAPRPGRLGTLGVAGLTLNGCLFTVGMLGEPIPLKVLTPRTFDPPKATLAAGNIVLSLLMILSGVTELARRRASRSLSRSSSR